MSLSVNRVSIPQFNQNNSRQVVFGAGWFPETVNEQPTLEERVAKEGIVPKLKKQLAVVMKKIGLRK